MDRLQEANKVANVMRRREHLRPLGSLQPGASAAAARRGFFRSGFTSPGLAAAAARSALRLPGPRALLMAGGFLPPNPVSGPGGGAKSAASRSLPPPPAQPMALRYRPAAGMRQAPAARTRLARGPESRRREFSGLKSFPLQMQWSRRSRALPKADLPLAGTLTQATRRETAARGNALRVSLSCGFRARPRPRVFPARRPDSDIRLRPGEAFHAPRAATPAAAAQKTCGPIAIPSGGVFCPPPPEHAGPRGLAQRVSRSGAPPARPGAVPEKRRAAPRWAAGIESISFPRAVFEPCRTSGYGSRPYIAIKPAAAPGMSESRHSLAPFVPQDVGYSFNVGPNANKDQKR